MAVRSQVMNSAPAGVRPGKGGLFGWLSAPTPPSTHIPAQAAPAASRPINRAGWQATAPAAERFFAWVLLALSFVSTGVFFNGGNWLDIVPVAWGGNWHFTIRFFLGLAWQAACSYIEVTYRYKRPLLYWFTVIFCDMLPSAAGLHTIVAYGPEKVFAMFNGNVLYRALVGWVGTLFVSYKMARYPELALVDDSQLITQP